MPLSPQNRIRSLLLAVACLVAVCQAACSVSKESQNILPTPILTRADPNNELVTTPTLVQGASEIEVEATDSTASTIVPIPDSGWQPLRPGLERRIIRSHLGGAAVPELFYILRIDPEYFEFGVGYHPGEAKRLTDWLVETGALIVVNAGYFTSANVATGLVITGGVSYGTTYQGFGGMLLVTSDGPELRSLVENPYIHQEEIVAGIQSFPMLVYPGNEIGYTEEDDSPARRTVIAQDDQGNFLLILATTGTYTLHSLAQYLVNSDLDLEIALNLDGGSSTGLLMAEPVDGVAPFTLLPVIISVYAK